MSRLLRYLDELDDQFEKAASHERAMLGGLEESESWSSPADREWIRGAARFATQNRERAAASRRLGYELASRADVDSAEIAERYQLLEAPPASGDPA